MEVRLEVSPESEVTVEKDAEGNIRAVVFKPFFTSPKARATLAYGRTKSDVGAELERFALGVQGGDGTVDKKTYTSVKASADLTPAEKAALEKSEKTETSETKEEPPAATDATTTETTAPVRRRNVP